jgi:uncharacterized protein YceH (UPF0502 family)
MEELTAEEVRVLGCLVEKQLTTPQAYPLTESALVTACNQTTNRDPITSYDQSTVRRTLLNLRQQGLARMVHRPGDRVEKHRHLLDEVLELSTPQIAVLSVLLLRGPQTVGELRTRTERMHAFGSLEEVDALLRELAERQPQPLVERMGRLPGQKEARYRHLLSGDEPPVTTESVTAPVAVAHAAPRPAPPPPSVAPDALEALRREVAQLRDRIARLEAALGETPDEN